MSSRASRSSDALRATTSDAQPAAVEQFFDPLMFVWCWVAYRLVMTLPIHSRGNALERFAFWLLPFAGYYAYYNPEHGTSWRWSERRRA